MEKRSGKIGSQSQVGGRVLIGWLSTCIQGPGSDCKAEGYAQSPVHKLYSKVLNSRYGFLLAGDII